MVIDELRAALGEKVSVNETIREHHSKDESFHTPTLPEAVVFATSTQDVATTLRICNANLTPVVAWGAGTSLEGNSTPVRGGVSLDLSQMDKILRVSSEDLDCTIQPGVRRKQLNEYLSRYGLFFPVDPGADATLGGMASTGASGTTTVKYGAMKQLVMSLTVVTANGEIITTSRRARKTSAGYDLTHLFVGSEGTLGVITELTLRVFGIPEVIAAATMQFDSVRDAIDGVIEAIQLNVGVARIELVDREAVVAVNRYSGTELPNKDLLLLEFHGSAESTAIDIAAAREVLERHGGQGFKQTTDEAERRKLWQARHDAGLACRSHQPGGRIFSTDVCVPISRLSECIEQTQKDLAESKIYGPLVGHVGDGNFHVLLTADPNDHEAIERLEQFHTRLVKRALSLEGTCTGEHGIGVGKIDYLVSELGREAVDVMAIIKAALDPNCIMNPGKVIAETIAV
ncbi:MAG: FAD-binding protein [Actinobacteria bacterium]|nr:FAD-binding protein [Actinomycetota bacterium]NCU87228.1 FAD-binding protein [Actinomycetota bacterium]NDA38068.1 FAD-binding protein [Acidimicrobiia bacterium]NDB26805.1 FAD-binding protein [Actinomycetota bacterium]NDD72338.1 FAD-binding protein [Actinomycetota bacterium]